MKFGQPATVGCASNAGQLGWSFIFVVFIRIESYDSVHYNNFNRKETRKDVIFEKKLYFLNPSVKGPDGSSFLSK